MKPKRYNKDIKRLIVALERADNEEASDWLFNHTISVQAYDDIVHYIRVLRLGLENRLR